MDRNIIRLKTTKKQKEQLAECYSWASYYADQRNGTETRGIVIAQCCSPQDSGGVIKAVFIENRWAQPIIDILRDRLETREILFRRF